MPYLLSRTKTNGAQPDQDCSAKRTAILELVSHGASANNDADPEEQREASAEFRARRRFAGRIPLCHFWIEELLINRGVDSQQQKGEQLGAKEHIPVSLAGLRNQKKATGDKHDREADLGPAQKIKNKFPRRPVAEGNPQQAKIEDHNHAYGQGERQNVATFNQGEQVV